jgi:hypothetical protein
MHRRKLRLTSNSVLIRSSVVGPARPLAEDQLLDLDKAEDPPWLTLRAYTS